MKLIVSGLPPVTEADRFRSLFGRYVYGFKHGGHCQKCFAARSELKVNPKMQNGEVELRDELFYLCGVGHRNPSVVDNPQFARRSTNVHLAVSPRKGSVAAMGSVYGATFVIEDAEAIAIRPLPDGFQGLGEEYWRCKMFQFAYQMFEVGEVRTDVKTAVHQLRKEWHPMAGIKKDSSGYMVDPGLVSRRRILATPAV